MARSLSTVWKNESASACNVSNVHVPTNRAAMEFCQTSDDNIGNDNDVNVLSMCVCVVTYCCEVVHLHANLKNLYYY